MLVHLKRSTKLFMDETRAPVMDPGAGKTKTGYLWALTRDDRGWNGGDPPAVVFTYAPGRSGSHAMEILRGFDGILQVDGYAGYNALAELRRVGGAPLTLAYCWAHSRRKLHDIYQKDGSEIAAEGLRRIATDPLLRAFAVLMFFGVGVGTLLYNEQAAIARAFYPDAESRTAYYANIDLAINLVTILVQVFLTRTLLVRFGVAPVLLIPAAAILLGFAALTASPLPLLVAVVQVATRAGEFSLAKPARETIYTRVDREARYKAKAAIDTVVYRGGDLAFAWLHKLMVVSGSQAVFAGGILVAGAFTASAWRVVKEQAKLPDDRH